MSESNRVGTICRECLATYGDDLAYLCLWLCGRSAGHQSPADKPCNEEAQHRLNQSSSAFLDSTFLGERRGNLIQHAVDEVAAAGGRVVF